MHVKTFTLHEWINDDGAVEINIFALLIGVQSYKLK